MDAFHERLIEIGLDAAARHGFALAGGYAVRAHQVVARVSEDIDLFTPYERRAEMQAATSHVIDAYEEAGYVVDIDVTTDVYVKVWVSDPPPTRQRIKSTRPGSSWLPLRWSTLRSSWPWDRCCTVTMSRLAR